MTQEERASNPVCGDIFLRSDNGSIILVTRVALDTVYFAHLFDDGVLETSYVTLEDWRSVIQELSQHPETKFHPIQDLPNATT